MPYVRTRPDVEYVKAADARARLTAAIDTTTEGRPMTLSEIMDATGLTESQVRRAWRTLELEEELVAVWDPSRHLYGIWSEGELQNSADEVIEAVRGLGELDLIAASAAAELGYSGMDRAKMTTFDRAVDAAG